MLWLRNLNQYDKPIREEFEHIIGQLSVFLSRIFDEDGNVIQDGSNVASPIKFIHYGDLAVNNGNTTGSSTLPQSVDVSKTALHFLGQTRAGGDTTSIRITLADSTTITGVRISSVGDATVNYCVVEYV